MARALTARATQGVSPPAQMSAWLDWATYSRALPDGKLSCFCGAQRSAAILAHFLARRLVADAINSHSSIRTSIIGLPMRRGIDFHLSSRNRFFLPRRRWRAATTEVRGMTPNYAARVSFSSLQFLNIFSSFQPAVAKSRRHPSYAGGGGANLIRGWNNFMRRPFA